MEIFFLAPHKKGCENRISAGFALAFIDAIHLPLTRDCRLIIEQAFMAGIAYLVDTLLGLSTIFTAQLHSLRDTVSLLTRSRRRY